MERVQPSSLIAPILITLDAEEIFLRATRNTPKLFPPSSRSKVSPLPQSPPSLILFPPRTPKLHRDQEFPSKFFKSTNFSFSPNKIYTRINQFVPMQENFQCNKFHLSFLIFSFLSLSPCFSLAVPKSINRRKWQVYRSR